MSFHQFRSKSVQVSAPQPVVAPNTIYGEAGNFLLTGNAAALTRTFVLNGATGAFALTGNSATVKIGRVVNGATGSYLLTGGSATLPRTYCLHGSTGAFTLTGNSASVLDRRIALADTGTFSLSGSDSTLAIGRKILSAAGAFTLTGNTASTTAQFVLPSESGEFTVTDESASLTLARNISTDTGEFIVSGNDGGLAYAVANTLLAVTGTFVFSGNDATVARSFILTGETGSFELSGGSAVFSRGVFVPERPPTSAGGAFFDFVTRPLKRHLRKLTVKRYVLKGSTGKFDVIGGEATLSRSRILPAETGIFTIGFSPGASLEVVRIPPKPVRMFDAPARAQISSPKKIKPPSFPHVGNLARRRIREEEEALVLSLFD